MKKKSRESLRDIANRIPKQSLCEILFPCNLCLNYGY